MRPSQFAAAFREELTKAAGSFRSRFAVQMGNPEPVMWKGQATGNTTNSATLMHAGQVVGSANLIRRGAGPYAVESSYIADPRFRGLGLGRKMYGEIMRQTGGRLLSDQHVSDSAARLWQGMARRSSYAVTRSPSAAYSPPGSPGQSGHAYSLGEGQWGTRSVLPNAPVGNPVFSGQLLRKDAR